MSPKNLFKFQKDRVRARKKGDYNHVYNPRAEEPKASGIK